ncbi:MAG: glycosyltransferase [Chitinophagales bacterium]
MFEKGPKNNQAGAAKITENKDCPTTVENLQHHLPPLVCSFTALENLVFIAIGCSAAYAAMIIYFLVGWYRTTWLKTLPENALPSVTVIIPVRNEAESIQECIRSVFRQNYDAGKMEVIVINDYSLDPTLRLAKEEMREGLKVLNLENYFGDHNEKVPNKKKAITLGIKNAKSELIVTTDGDCLMSENWLRTMVAFYQSNSYKLVTAPVMMAPAKGLLGLFQQLDVISLSGITCGTIANGFPTMCNGANLIYEKKTFLEVDGFKGNMDVPTGDDVFLMQKIETLYPRSIGFLKHADACVFSKPEPSLSTFFSQRIRWTSKSTQFKRRMVTVVLVFAWLYNFAVLAAAGFAFYPIKQAWIPVAILGGTKFFFDVIFNIGVAHFYKRKIVLLLSPLFEVFHILYVVLIGLFSLRGRYKWKYRKIVPKP